MSKSRAVRRLSWPFLYAMATALGDVWTTKRGIALGAKELNPIARPFVKRGRYDLLFVLKAVLLATATVRGVQKGETPEERIALARSTFLWHGHIIGVVVLLNLWTLRRLKRAAQK